MRRWQKPAEVRGRPRRGVFAAGLLTGGALEYALDPGRGRQRREHAAGLARRAAHRLKRQARAAALRTVGRTRGALHHLQWRPAVRLDEATLTHKVETVLFRDPEVPKGALSINAEGGTVFLRGQVESVEAIERIVQSVRRIPEAREVVSLLHLPGTPAPHPGARSERSVAV